MLGGAGFLGRHAISALLKAGYAVRVFDREGCNLSNIAHLLPHVDMRVGDFADATRLTPALEDVYAVLHLVGTTIAQTSNENPVYDVESNVLPTLRLLSLASERGIDRVVFSSSGGTVYGVPTQVPIPETHSTDPICAYGISKLAIEKYLALHQRLHGLRFVILRFSNPFGEGQHALGLQGVINVFLRRIRDGHPLEVWGDGAVVRDYLYAEDAGESFVRAVETPAVNEVYNIGSGTGRSLNDLLQAFRDVLGLQATVRHEPSRVFDVPANVLDVRKAARLLSWSPSTPFAEGLRRTWDWIREG